MLLRNPFNKICSSFLYVFSLFNLKNHPEFQGWLINTCHSSIYIFSKFQIKVTNIYNTCKTMICNHPWLSEYIKNFGKTKINYDIEFVYEGYITRINKEDILNSNNVKFYKKIPYDFVIYSDYDQVLKTINKIIIPHFPNEKDLQYQKSEIKFLLSEILIDDNTVKVDFRTNEYNYYIEKNIFSNKFLNFFMHHYYPDSLSKDKDYSSYDFKLKIIDHNVVNAFFDSKNILKINKTDYEKIQITDNTQIVSETISEIVSEMVSEIEREKKSKSSDKDSTDTDYQLLEYSIEKR